MTRIEVAYEELASRGETRGAESVYAEAVGIVERHSPRRQIQHLLREDRTVVSHTNSELRPRRGVAVLSAVFLVVLAIGIGTAYMLRTPPAPGDVGNGPLAPPAVAVPNFNPGAVTPTVAFGNELSYYNYLPDLELAWGQTANGGTDICWRTLSGEGCASDDFSAPDVVLIQDGDVLTALTRAEFVPDGTTDAATGSPGGKFVEPTQITIVLSTGETLTELVAQPEGIGISYARFNIGDATVQSAVAE